jgi:hypothetical protein
MRFEPAILEEELEGELADLLPERQTLMGLSINIAPVINVDPVIVVGNAIAVQAATIASSNAAALGQWVTVP